MNYLKSHNIIFVCFFFFSSRRRHTRFDCDWSSDVLFRSGFVDSYDSFRSGIGQAIVLPLANDSLLVYNVSGKARAWVPLSLDGQPAHVVGSIGYLRAPEEPPVLFLPLRSSAEIGRAHV